MTVRVLKKLSVDHCQQLFMPIPSEICQHWLGWKLSGVVGRHFDASQKLLRSIDESIELYAHHSKRFELQTNSLARKYGWMPGEFLAIRFREAHQDRLEETFFSKKTVRKTVPLFAEREFVELDVDPDQPHV